MQTKTTLDTLAAVSGASASIENARTSPVELDLTAMRLVAGGLLPRATWGAASAVAADGLLPRATW